MQVVPVLFEDYSESIKYSNNKWYLSDSTDVFYRFDTYINAGKAIGSWGSNGTLDENFLVII